MSNLITILTALALRTTGTDDDAKEEIARAGRAIRQLVLDHIGYEQTTQEDGRTFISAADGIRNELRAELRNKVPEL